MVRSSIHPSIAAIGSGPSPTTNPQTDRQTDRQRASEREGATTAASVGGSRARGGGSVLLLLLLLLLRLLSQTRSESRENGGQARASGRMYEEACLGRCCHALSQFENRSRTECPRRGLSCVALPDVTTCRWRCIRAQLS